MVGASRFERPTSRTPSECATGLRHAPTPWGLAVSRSELLVCLIGERSHGLFSSCMNLKCREYLVVHSAPERLFPRGSLIGFGIGFGDVANIV